MRRRPSVLAVAALAAGLLSPGTILAGPRAGGRGPGARPEAPARPTAPAARPAGTLGEARPDAPSRARRAVAEVFADARVALDGPRPDVVVKDPAFYRRFLSDPRLELGETYMDGLWESPSIDRFVTKLLRSSQQQGRIKMARPLWRTPGLAASATVKHGYRYVRDRLTNRQSRARSTKVATEHYDIGNELYRRMLDPTLTYTSGIWAPGYTLEDAQNAKYDLIARKLGLRPGQHVLDIGCGFGGFARFAAKHYGAKVTGITISVEQLKLARELSVDVPGVEFVFSDYRDIGLRFPPGTFDHIVSIEMIEAVGQQNLKAYFDAAHGSLKDGGRFVLQGIAENHDVVNSNPWFSKYIFHDGVAPSTRQVDRAAARSFGAPVDRHRMTEDYDRTLMAWHENFTRAWPALKDRYDARFKRMWDFYLLSVAGGFRSGTMQLYQSVYVKGGRAAPAPVRELPSRRRLDAMRASAADRRATALSIADVDNRTAAIKASAVPHRRPRVPVDKKARIAVIGAGPAGLSSALELKKLGYENVVVFERDAEAGGKSRTVSLAGRPHDLGATMGVKWKYHEIERRAREERQETIPFPRQVHYELATGKPTKKSIGTKLKLGVQALLYLVHRRRMEKAGVRGLEVPPAELADGWSVVMGRNGLGAFDDTMKTYLTGYGYGGPETPAVFGERMLDTDAVLGAVMAPPMMWRNGTQPIWKGVADDLDVRLSTEIVKVERTSKGVHIHARGAERPQTFDKLVMAVDPKTALKVLDATPEEWSLFSRVKYMPYATFAVRVEGFSEGKAEVGYLKENMTLDRPGRPMAWIKRYADDDVFVFHLFAPASLSDEQVMANIASDMRRLGATKTTLVDSRRWPFFPHVDSEAMREEKFFERAANLQGRNDTVFVNEALAMSTMADSAELARNVAGRMASGEYGEE